jgi:hypothetical protein
MWENWSMLIPFFMEGNIENLEIQSLAPDCELNLHKNSCEISVSRVWGKYAYSLHEFGLRSKFTFIQNIKKVNSHLTC